MEETHSEGIISFSEQHRVTQSNTSYYDFKWGKVKDPSKNNSWNWAAFFLTTIWLAYRKMYKPFLLFCAIELIWLALSFCADIPLWADFIFYGITSFLVGFYANRWYFKHTNYLLEKANKQPRHLQEAYLRTKGGAHIGIAIGWTLLGGAVYFAADYGLSYLPTETNVKDIMRYSEEAPTLESYNDHPKWQYLKKEGRYYIVQFTGYDYTYKEHVRILFHVYLDKQIYEWNSVYINDERLSKEDAIEYEYWIQEDSDS